MTDMSIRRMMLPMLVALCSACSDDDFSGSAAMIELSVNPGTISVARGSSGSVNVTLLRSVGFTNPVGLSVAGLPAGITATIAPDELVGALTTSVITTTVGSAVATGNYPTTVKATSSGVGEATVVFQISVP
jgi:hypothetical protein